MMSGFSTASMVLTPCHTDPVQGSVSNGSSNAAVGEGGGGHLKGIKADRLKHPRIYAIVGDQLNEWGRYAHRVHRASHRVRTARVLFIIVSKIFSDFSGCQGRGGLRGKHTTTEASTPSSSPTAWWL